MNKLEVALKLFQLLNERREIDSKTVARELDVSLRTAQRYLSELATLPCVTNEENHRTYSLNGDYKLKDALKNGEGLQSDRDARMSWPPRANLSQTVCHLCCRARSHSGSAVCPAAVNKGAGSLNEINKLTSIISKRLTTRRRGVS